MEYKEIKPCPKCGGPGRIVFSSNNRPITIMCEDCGYTLPCGIFDEVLKQWNKENEESEYKWSEYEKAIPCPFTPDVEAMALENMIQEAYRKAVIHNIEANTILLNPKIGYMIGFPMASEIGPFRTVVDYPPMIFGMEAYINPDMPEGVGFQLLHREHLRRDQLKLEIQNELLESMREMSLREVVEMVYGEVDQDH